MKYRPIIAILRGINPSEAESVSNTLIEEGITIIEVPLNSPKPLLSLEIMVKCHGNKAIFGAGTVLNVDQVQRVNNTGSKLIVSPNCDIAVIKKTKCLNMISIPGCFTATEAINALHNGADGLKFFPAFQLGTKSFEALSAILPQNLMSFAVGGIDALNFKDWLNVNISGFGLGSSLYKPGMDLIEIRKKTRDFVKLFDIASNNKIIDL